MHQNLELLLREHCNLIDWKPTFKQLISIEKDISAAILNGERLSKSDCQYIVIKHCGSTKTFVLDSVDNSDLNTLLALAVKKDSDS